MKAEALTRVAFLTFCVAVVISGKASAQPPPPPHRKVPNTVQRATIEILEVNPSAPTAGQLVTVTYKIASTGFGNTPLTGHAAGTFQGQRLVELNGAPAPWITLQPSESRTGQLMIASPAAGDDTLTVTFNGPLVGCNDLRNPTPCIPQLFASASTQLHVAQPNVHVRISGATYTNLSRPDSNDGSVAPSGYQCVVHDPGCGWWGNAGSDKYFNTKSLPPGAKLEGSPQFVEFWPKGIDSSLAGGNGLGTGSYGASLSSNPPSVEVKWNNACWSVFGRKKVYYSISFLVSMPMGTDLGEPSFDPASLTTSPCALDGYLPGPQKPVPEPIPASGWSGQVWYCNPTTQGETLYLHLRGNLVQADPGAQGDASPMVEDNLPLQFSQGGSAGSQSGFQTAKKYKQGTWQITDAYVTLSPTSPPNATVKHAPLAQLPFNALLPGSPGSPVIDFRGGSCL
jgi:hypothetical protein